MRTAKNKLLCGLLLGLLIVSFSQSAYADKEDEYVVDGWYVKYYTIDEQMRTLRQWDQNSGEPFPSFHSPKPEDRLPVPPLEDDKPNDLGGILALVLLGLLVCVYVGKE